MDDVEELVKFRQEWKAELQEPDEHEDYPDASKNTTPAQQRHQSNTLQPFIIADKLLEGQTAAESLTHIESDLAKDYFEKKPKRLRLESQDKAEIVQKSKPQSLVDVFLNDLVRTSSQMHILKFILSIYIF